MQPARILFSTTTGWNPGDEVIHLGILNVLEDAGIEFEESIYNRNPALYRESVARLGPGAVDADYVIFSGTPEWSQEFPSFRDLMTGPRSPRFWARWLRLRRTDRVNDPLLRYIITRGIRCSMLGVGSSKRPTVTSKIRKILEEHTDVFTVRDSQTFEVFQEFSPVKTACPSFFSVKDPEPRKRLGRGAVVVQAPHSTRIKLDSDALDRTREAVDRVFSGVPEALIVCHTQRDLGFARETFPGREAVVGQSVRELLDIYKDLDVVCATRLHGCGLACAYGIPAYQLFHGYRMEALKQFPVSNHKNAGSVEQWLNTLDVERESRRILDVKKEKKKELLTLLTRIQLPRS